ncbi:MAG: hypothetical protein A3F84_18415 [Candidatus Handelsmanbacteria bacterium RIFCSPLOWO2_12_FULL_64_10]|uniref:Uncharacterized protein n=1 Tax=Handelsmanbacteria sp. (strain RIFCSPLOWO2_12_FULL_64_10) TaxID=1817868 RepID=A0A1F6C977_HANXR|nr:MAG: hypothetical protein A3F84_18415 [Candidatus Handelsmanbacteria bacterium RIFCSPLOWO2_12_FULL_64_10]
MFTKPSPTGPAWTETVRRLDEAFERRWSFRVVSYQVRRREVLVLGELSAAGQVRQQFGAARIASLDFGESARVAALDALVQGARLFGIDAGERQQEAPPPPSPLRQRLGQVRAEIERLPGGEQTFREVLRQFEVRRPEQVPEEALPDVLSRCEQIYRVPLPSSTNGRSVHA